MVGETVFPPCTPYGVVKLLEYEGIPVEGKNVVVVGASNIVGKPMAADADAAGRHGLDLPRQDPRSSPSSPFWPTSWRPPPAIRT